MRYSIDPSQILHGLSGFQGGVLQNVMAEDGTIQVSHNGTEIDQGINTRVVQEKGVTACTIQLKTKRNQQKNPNQPSTRWSFLHLERKLC